MKRTDTNKSRAYLITDLSKSVSDWVTSRMRKRPKKWARRAKLIGWRWPLESWNVWFMNFFCLVLREHLNKISGDDSQVVPPVPIPNTVVKHLNVESTWMETSWEDRKLPVYWPAQERKRLGNRSYTKCSRNRARRAKMIGWRWPLDESTCYLQVSFLYMDNLFCLQNFGCIVTILKH